MRMHKRFLIGAAALLSTVGLTACGMGGGGGGGGSDSSGDKTPVVVASWGGSFDEGLQKAFYDDFTKDTGVEVVIVPPDYGRWAAMNDQKASEWNSTDASNVSVAEWINKGYLQKLPADAARSDLVPENYRDYAANGYLVSFVMVYNKKTYADGAPATWQDFFDEKKFPGKRGLTGSYETTAEAGLLGDGVAPEDLYPLDIDRAFKKWGSLSDLTVTTGYAELVQAVDSGNVDIAFLPSGSAARAVEANPDLAISWDNNISQWAAMPFSASGPNKAAAKKLMTYMQDPKRQGEFASISYYGPANTEALQYVDKDVLPYLTSEESNFSKTVEQQTDSIVKQFDEYQDAFNAFLAKS